MPESIRLATVPVSAGEVPPYVVDLLDTFNDNVGKLNARMFTFQDYAAIGYKARRMTFTELGNTGRVAGRRQTSLPTSAAVSSARGCLRILRPRGLETAIAQCSIATNHQRGTIRGLHFKCAA